MTEPQTPKPASYPWHWDTNPAVRQRLTDAYGSPAEAGKEYAKAQAAGAPSLLAAAITEATADEIMAALRTLDNGRWETIAQRMHWISEWEALPDDGWYIDRMDAADHAALVAASTDPEVSRWADDVMGEIHADMDRGLVPRTVGAFTFLHDYLDANEYLIRHIEHPAPDCDCKTRPDTQAGEVHEDECASRLDGGSLDKALDLDNAVAAEVSRRLAVEAVALRNGQVPGSPLTEVPAPTLTATPGPGGGVIITPQAGPLAHDLNSGGSPWRGTSTGEMPPAASDS
jgi:hypothetical protein